QGVLGLALRVWRRHPFISIQAFAGGTLLEFINTPALTRDYLFCAHTPENIVESCMRRAEPESIRASAIDPMFRRVKTGRVTDVGSRRRARRICQHRRRPGDSARLPDRAGILPRDGAQHDARTRMG